MNFYSRGFLESCELGMHLHDWSIVVLVVIVLVVIMVVIVIMVVCFALSSYRVVKLSGCRISKLATWYIILCSSYLLLFTS